MVSSPTPARGSPVALGRNAAAAGVHKVGGVRVRVRDDSSVAEETESPSILRAVGGGRALAVRVLAETAVIKNCFFKKRTFIWVPWSDSLLVRQLLKPVIERRVEPTGREAPTREAK